MNPNYNEWKLRVRIAGRQYFGARRGGGCTRCKTEGGKGEGEEGEEGGKKERGEKRKEKRSLVCVFGACE